MTYDTIKHDSIRIYDYWPLIQVDSNQKEIIDSFENKNFQNQFLSQ